MSAPNQAMVPFAEVERLAKATAVTGFFAGVETAERALVLMMIAQAEGVHPVQAMQRYHVIKGKPSKQAWAMLADFTASGGKVEWHEHSATKCDATFSHPLGGTIRVDWNMDKARAAGLAGGDNWRKYPENMLHARCVSNGVRFVFPAAANGLYTPEEVQDFDSPFTAIPAEDRAVEVVATPSNVQQLKPATSPKKEPKAPVKKWTPDDPLPEVIIRGLPKEAHALAGKRLADLVIEDLEQLTEVGKRAYVEWSQMPGTNPKLLKGLQEITVHAHAFLDKALGCVPPPDDQDAPPPSDFDQATGEVRS
jgi:hypothetical protein